MAAVARDAFELTRVLFAAGVALALTVLTKANLALFAPLALFWLGRRRWLYAALGVVALLGPWVVRTWRITGTPILYSNGGFSLWTAIIG